MFADGRKAREAAKSLEELAPLSFFFFSFWMWSIFSKLLSYSSGLIFVFFPLDEGRERRRRRTEAS
jgi:hypothetical protein